MWREGYENRPYSQLDGSGQLAWQYSGFKELHLRARLAFPADGSGKAGVFCGDVFCCLNYDTQRVELYKGSTLLGSYSQTISRTPNADLRGNLTMYTVEMRIRGNRVRVYSGASYALRFTIGVLQENSPTKDVDGKLEELQKQLLQKANRNEQYDDLVEEIYKLREEKQQILADKAEMEGVKQSIFNMKAFLNSQTAEIEEYDEQLVRRLIAKVTVFDDKFEVELKSGLSVDIRRNK